MKKSIFNHIVSLHGRDVLYNSYTDNLAMLDPALTELYRQHPVQEIADRHPELYRYMVAKRFLIPANADEWTLCIEDWDKTDAKSKSFGITINPTLSCNMNCWYCYEHHDGNKRMSPDLTASVMALIDAKATDSSLDNLHLTFFGGEPLLEFDEIVKPLIQRTQQVCIANGKTLTLTFVTNAYLLDQDTAAWLDKLGCKVHIQVTLDGDSIHHDAVRHTVNGNGSFNRITANIDKCLNSTKFNFTVRLNYTHRNIMSFADIIPLLEVWCSRYGDRLICDFQHVWQDAAYTLQVQDSLQRVKTAFRKASIPLAQAPESSKYRCYADRSNHIGINYDGTLFHCTARDFNPANSEGFIDNTGKTVHNEKALLRTRLKWGYGKCRTCKAYPLCHGKCSQFLIENQGKEGCPLGYSDEDIDSLIDRRVEFLLDASTPEGRLMAKD